MALGILIGGVTIAAGIGLLSLSGWFISAAAFAGLSLTSAQMFNIFLPSVGVRFFAILRITSRYAERIVTHETTFRMLENLRTWFYQHLEPLAPARLLDFHSGDILNRIVADIESLDNLYLRVLAPSIVAALMSFALLVFLWFFAPYIALVSWLLLFGAGFAVSLAILKIGEQTGRSLALRTATLRVGIVESLQGLAELMIYDRSRTHLDAIDHNNRRLIENQLRMSRIRGMSTALMILLSGTAVLIALYIGAGMVNRQELNGANLALIILALMAAFEAVSPLPNAYLFLGRTREAGRRLLEIIDTQPAVAYPQQPSAPPQQFDIAFENVGFRYRDSDPEVLSGVNFDLPQGGRLAILGETGAGKTTLLNLLVRFWDPAEGRICIGGTDIRRLREADLRNCIAVVSQQAHMFNASLKDNLLIARPTAGDQDLRIALDAARLLDFVDSLPRGMDTWIGESGKLLSAGQARRLAVARAILKDAPIWVLDEPTEGLDRITEQELIESLLEVTENRTVVLITHRLAALDRMDQVIVLANGRIAEQGPHATLIEDGQRYADYHSKWV